MEPKKRKQLLDIKRNTETVINDLSNIKNILDGIRISAENGGIQIENELNELESIIDKTFSPFIEYWVSYLHWNGCPVFPILKIKPPLSKGRFETVDRDINMHLFKKKYEQLGDSITKISEQLAEINSIEFQSVRGILYGLKNDTKKYLQAVGYDLD